MKKLLILFILFSVFASTAYSVDYSKYQRKNLGKFTSLKRKRHRVAFKNRSYVAHPAVRKDFRKMLKQRYAENIINRSPYSY